MFCSYDLSLYCLDEILIIKENFGLNINDRTLFGNRREFSYLNNEIKR